MRAEAISSKRNQCAIHGANLNWRPAERDSDDLRGRSRLSVPPRMTVGPHSSAVIDALESTVSMSLNPR